MSAAKPVSPSHSLKKADEQFRWSLGANAGELARTRRHCGSDWWRRCPAPPPERRLRYLSGFGQQHRRPARALVGIGGPRLKPCTEASYTPYRKGVRDWKWGLREICGQWRGADRAHCPCGSPRLRHGRGRGRGYRPRAGGNWALGCFRLRSGPLVRARGPGFANPCAPVRRGSRLTPSSKPLHAFISSLEDPLSAKGLSACLAPWAPSFSPLRSGAQETFKKVTPSNRLWGTQASRWMWLSPTSIG